jgi:hypothetical protein
MTEPKLNADGAATLDVPMGNKINHLTFDYTETAMLAAILAHLPWAQRGCPPAAPTTITVRKMKWRQPSGTS